MRNNLPQRENFTQKREVHASSKSKITDLLANLTGIADAKASHMKVKVPIPFLALAATLFVTTSLETRAQSIIIQHSGDADPLTEGFGDFSIGSGPVINDMGVNAWATQCHAVNGGSHDGSFYQYALTSQQQAEMSGLGWIFSVDLRITTTNASRSVGFQAGVDTGSEGFDLQFGSTSNGDPSVAYVDYALGITNTINLNGAGSSYNLYQLIYNAAMDQVGLFINGAEYGDYVPSVEQINPRVYFGTGGHTGTGNEQANWNLVSFSVPEPSVLFLILAGGGIFIFVRIFKKIILRKLFTFNRFTRY